MSRLDLGLKYIKIYVLLDLKTWVYLQLLLGVILLDKNCPIYNYISGGFSGGKQIVCFSTQQAKVKTNLSVFFFS